MGRSGDAAASLGTQGSPAFFTILPRASPLCVRPPPTLSASQCEAMPPSLLSLPEAMLEHALSFLEHRER